MAKRTTNIKLPGKVVSGRRTIGKKPGPVVAGGSSKSEAIGGKKSLTNPKHSSNYGKAVLNGGGNKTAPGKSTLQFHDQTFHLVNGKWTRANGKAVGAAGTKLIQAALKAGSGAAPGKGTIQPPAAATDPEWFKNGVIDPKTGLQTFTDADSTYLDTQNSVVTALNNSLLDNNAESQSYDTTFLNDLRDLGLQGGNFTTDATGKSVYAGGTWDMHDALTQSGKAFNDQTNDFAARGMLQSSGYGTAGTNLSRALTKQVANANLSRQSYQGGLASLGASQQQQASDALIQAKREAISRRANKYATNASAVMTS